MSRARRRRAALVEFLGVTVIWTLYLGAILGVYLWRTS